MTSVFSDMLTGDGCTAVAEGGSITPVAGGSCFELTNDDSKDDSTFVIDTTGLTGLVVFAQLGPSAPPPTTLATLLAPTSSRSPRKAAAAATLTGTVAFPRCSVAFSTWTPPCTTSRTRAMRSDAT